MHTKTQTDTVTENLKEGIGVFNPFGGGLSTYST